jgi:type IV secretory pathway component VirB8
MKECVKNEYFEAAFDWQTELKANRERIMNLYQKFLVGLFGCVCALSIALAVTISKKETVPFLAIADQRTGEITTPHKIDKTQDISFPMLKHLVLTYVQARESYNHINLNTPYHQVLTMSSNKIAKGYRNYIQPKENAQSPITILGKSKYIKVDIHSVNQLPGKNLLDVRFSQKLMDANSEHELEAHDYRVTIGWDVSNQAQSLKALELNPLNFKVTHYDKQPITV